MLNGEELIRLVDAIHRDKDIGKEVLFEAIETALLTAVRKRYGERPELAIEIERETGEIIAWDGDEEALDVDIGELGRIAAQTAKQVIIQKIRDAERDVIYGDYEDKVNQVVTGTVQRIEGGNIIVNLGRAEGIIPRHEKVRSENYNPGDRIKAVIYDVKKIGPKVKIMLSRADPEIVKKLFELEVPEIAEHVIEIRSIAREPGFRTKIAVHSVDSRVDCIGACVGIRGTRIKSITDELNGEKIDIIRWSDSLDELILNALRPAQISDIEIDESSKEARVLVPEDQLSLAIGRKGQNVRLASRLTGYEIQIQSPTQAAMEHSSQEDDQDVERARAALFGDGGASAKEPAATTPAQETSSDEDAAVGEDSGVAAGATEPTKEPSTPPADDIATTASTDDDEATVTPSAGAEATIEPPVTQSELADTNTAGVDTVDDSGSESLDVSETATSPESPKVSGSDATAGDGDTV